MPASLTDQFLDLYKRIEYVGRAAFFPQIGDNENIIGRLMNLPQLAKIKEELNYCRVVRNFLTHNPRVGGAYPIEPSAQIIKLLERVLAMLENPPKAIDYAIKRKQMLKVNPHDYAIDTMRRMREKAYTHVPVIEKGRLVGVFSDSVVNNYICGANHIEITDETPLSHFRHYYRLDAPDNQVYAFVPADTPLDVVEDIFQDYYKKRQLISVVYITQNGKQNESILGMITPWDLLIDE